MKLKASHFQARQQFLFLFLLPFKIGNEDVSKNEVTENFLIRQLEDWSA
jgi:hypothetical protein